MKRGVVNFKYSCEPSLIIDLAGPLSTRMVKFFFMAISSTMWYFPSDTVSKLENYVLVNIHAQKSPGTDKSEPIFKNWLAGLLYYAGVNFQFIK